MLLDEDGRVYLADFGIAKMLESSGGLTATGMITGTPQYMAPEQATGTKVGPAADIYALGIVAYEMLTGRVPFAADTPVAIMMKHVQEPLPLPPPERVSEPLLRAILKCTAKKPEERWPSAGAFVGGARGRPRGAHAAGRRRADGRRCRRRRPTVARREWPTAPPAPPTRRPQPLVSPTPPAPRHPRARGGLAPAALIGLGIAGVLVLAGAVGVAVLVLRGGPKPAASPSPTVAVAATPLPERRSVPAAAPATPTPQLPAPLPAATAAPRRDTAPLAAPTPTPSVPRPVTPTPVSTPEPTPTPARPAEPAAPAVDPEVQRLVAALGRPGPRRAPARGAGPRLPRPRGRPGPHGPDRGPRRPHARRAAARGRGPRADRPRGAPAPSRRWPRPCATRTRWSAPRRRRPSASWPKRRRRPRSRSGEALASPDVAVRREAAKALARVGRGAEPALRALLAALGDKDKTVRAQAARALGRIGPPARAAVPALTAMSRDSDVIVSREARAALESIGGPDLVAPA